MVIAGLVVILLLVLALPFLNHKIEENLEPFLFVMGTAAAFISGKMDVELLLEALKEPIMIASAVFIAGALFFIFKGQFSHFINKLVNKMPLAIVVFIVVLVLGFLSSVITAIVASIILVEIINSLPLERKNKIVVCVLACFAIGLGASLTPIGEPLATIAISKLDKDFFFLIDLLGKYIIPAVLVFAVMAAVYAGRVGKQSQQASGNLEHEIASTAEAELQDEPMEEDSWKTIIVRSLKVYLFVMALVFLGEGFEPLIEAYILGLSPNLLYWVNMVSAVLDNATLCAAEVSPAMSELSVEAILMGLLISGGMLVPGNIPNIISASKLKITSKEWAVLGVPIGLVFMIVFYVLLPL